MHFISNYHIFFNFRSITDLPHPSTPTPSELQSPASQTQLSLLSPTSVLKFTGGFVLAPQPGRREPQLCSSVSGSSSVETGSDANSLVKISGCKSQLVTLLIMQLNPVWLQNKEKCLSVSWCSLASYPDHLLPNQSSHTPNTWKNTFLFLPACCLCRSDIFFQS